MFGLPHMTRSSVLSLLGVHCISNKYWLGIYLFYDPGGEDIKSMENCQHHFHISGWVESVGVCEDVQKV